MDEGGDAVRIVTQHEVLQPARQDLRGWVEPFDLGNQGLDLGQVVELGGRQQASAQGLWKPRLA